MRDPLKSNPAISIEVTVPSQYGVRSSFCVGDFVFVSMIVQLDFEPVPTVWYSVFHFISSIPSYIMTTRLIEDDNLGQMMKLTGETIDKIGSVI